MFKTPQSPIFIGYTGDTSSNPDQITIRGLDGGHGPPGAAARATDRRAVGICQIYVFSFK